MRVIAVVATIASCAIISIAQSARADALSLVDLALAETTPTLLENIAQSEHETSQDSKEESQESNTQKQPVKHTVQSGESLTHIARRHHTTWQRIFYKNDDIADPNHLRIGQIVVIPEANEQLEERPLPKVTPPQPAHTQSAARVSKNAPVRQQPTRSPVSVAGNRYVYGYCTWYVKNRRPDLPNNLGDAISWVRNAASSGYATGSSPRAGAVGQQGNHVVYVESVNGDGTVTVSEMNWRGWNIINSRTVPASTFTYIY